MKTSTNVEENSPLFASRNAMLFKANNYRWAYNQYKEARLAHHNLAQFCTLDDLLLLWHVGLHYQNEGNYDGAIECYERICELNPPTPQIVNLSEVKKRCACAYFTKERQLQSSSSMWKFFSSFRHQGNQHLSSLSQHTLKFVRHGSLQVGQELARSDVKKVHVGSFKKAPNHPVVIKYSDMDELEWYDFVHELIIHSDLIHPNIVSMFAVCTSPLHSCIILEYMNLGSLSHCLEKKSIAFNDANKRLIGDATTSAVAYLHERNIVHQDIKSANVLVHQQDGQLMVKLSDFGCAHAIDATTSAGTDRWLAPEVKKYGVRCSKASDVYALAILLCVTEVVNQSTVLTAISDRKFNALSSKVMPNLFTLLTQCWNENPEQRPTIEKVQSTRHDIYAGGFTTISF